MIAGVSRLAGQPLNTSASILIDSRDDCIHTRMLYKALHASSMSKNYVVQDLTLRYATAEKSIDYTTKSFGIWPLWLYQLPESLTYSPFLLFRKGD
jgi:hypothetical protein